MAPRHIDSVLSDHLNVPGFEMKLDPAWSSLNPNHRRLVRDAVRYCTKGDDSILDLSRIPSLEHYSVSISHCKGVGGFVIGEKRIALGFDVEVNARLTNVNLALVAFDPTELSEAPSLPAFWTVKEAAFKSLRDLQDPSQPRGLKDLRIGKWNSVSAQQLVIYRCEVEQIGDRKVNGFSALAVDDGAFTYAVCWKERFFD
jgi:phosphopantetheinyl transferase (holo-ACP synthase)